MDEIIEIIKNEIVGLNNSIGKNGDLQHNHRYSLFKGIPEQSEHEKSLRNKLFIATEKKCAFHTWPIWSRLFDDTDLMDVLKLTDGNCATESILKKLGSLKTLLENKFSLGEEYFPAIFAGFACLSATHSCLFGIEILVDANDELEIDVEDWMACFYSSIAYAGNAAWEDNPNNQKRKEFWQWYINTCCLGVLSEMTET